MLLFKRDPTGRASAQGTRPDSAILGYGETGRVPGGSVLAIVLTNSAVPAGPPVPMTVGLNKTTVLRWPSHRIPFRVQPMLATLDPEPFDSSEAVGEATAIVANLPHR
jgi:hypothetical protein